jgi:hypothetical protein
MYMLLYIACDIIHIGHALVYIHWRDLRLAVMLSLFLSLSLLFSFIFHEKKNLLFVCI